MLRRALFAVASTVVIAIGVELLLPSLAGAQSTNATVDGMIRDDQGGVLPGATVTVVNQETGLTRSVVTGERGTYRVSELPPGRYSVKIELAGFASVDRQDIVLALGGNVTLKIDLW